MTDQATVLDANGNQRRADRVLIHDAEGGGPARRYQSPSTNYLLPANTAAANQDAALVSASARAVHKVTGYKATAGVAYLKLYNKATSPTSADTPIATIPLLASAGFDIDLKGLPVTNGLGYRLTGAVANNDTTTLTANDVLALNISYST